MIAKRYLPGLAAVVISVVVAAAGGAAEPPQAASVANRQLVLRYFSAFLSHGDEATADSILSPKVRFHGTGPQPIEGIQQLKDVVHGLRSALPDLAFSTDIELADDTFVMSRFTFTGSHTGTALMGIPAQGRKVTVTGVDVFRVEHGKIAEIWIYFDTAGLLAQLRDST